jgi:hypothetical protein
MFHKIHLILVFPLTVFFRLSQQAKREHIVFPCFFVDSLEPRRKGGEFCTSRFGLEI